MATRGPESHEPRILFEDPSLVAVLKPHRMHCAPGLGGGGLCAWVFERYPESRTLASGTDRGSRSPSEGGLLHRLDFDTSGIVLFARDAAAYDSLRRQQASGGFIKQYLALCSASPGRWPEGSLPPEGRPDGIDTRSWAEALSRNDAVSLASMLDAPSGNGVRAVESSFRSFGPRGSRVACVLPEAYARARDAPRYRSAILGCRILYPREESAGGTPILELRVSLSRGFRHQVRAHLAWIGMPILGDPLYGGLTDERLRLYADALAFAHPRTGEPIFLSSDRRLEDDIAFRP